MHLLRRKSQQSEAFPKIDPSLPQSDVPQQPQEEDQQQQENEDLSQLSAPATVTNPRPHNSLTYSQAIAQTILNQFRHPREKYEFLEELGRGKFGVVHKARNIVTNQFVAIKIVSLRRSAAKRRVGKEIDILTRLNHPNIVRLIEHFQESSLLGKKVYLVMELVDGGELFSYLAERDTIGESQARDIMRQLFECLEYIHKQGVVHRDLKPENILLQRHGDFSHIKLADFGISKLFSLDEKNRVMSTLCGTREFLAPEMLGLSGYGPAVDMWACGVIMYVLLSGSLPFSDPDEVKLFQKILTSTYEFPPEPWSRISNDAKDLIRHLLVSEPEDRFTPTEALNHVWVQAPDPSLCGEAFPGRLQQYQKELKSYRHWRQFTNTISAARVLQEYSHHMKSNKRLSPLVSPKFRRDQGANLT